MNVTCSRYRDLGRLKSLWQILLEQSDSDGLKLGDSLFVAKDGDISVDLKSWCGTKVAQTNFDRVLHRLSFLVPGHDENFGDGISQDSEGCMPR